MSPSVACKLNLLGLSTIGVVLLIAFIDQIIFHDIPCPLCLLQRIGFAGVGIGLALNIRFGPRPSHYALTILSAVVGTIISGRQILLHIIPGTGAYGHIILGMHFYTWAFILFSVIIIGAAVMLFFDCQFSDNRFVDNTESIPILNKTGRVIIVVFALLVFCNAVSTVFECAGGLCAANPVKYQLIQ